MPHAARCVRPRSSSSLRLVFAPLTLVLLTALAGPASADIVTGTVTPATAKVVVLDTTGETVAQLKPGPYQLQLPIGKYVVECQAPKTKTIDLLVLSEPVSLNVDCSR